MKKSVVILTFILLAILAGNATTTVHRSAMATSERQPEANRQRSKPGKPLLINDTIPPTIVQPRVARTDPPAGTTTRVKLEKIGGDIIRVSWLEATDDTTPPDKLKYSVYYTESLAGRNFPEPIREKKPMLIVELVGETSYDFNYPKPPANTNFTIWVEVEDKAGNTAVYPSGEIGVPGSGGIMVPVRGITITGDSTVESGKTLSLGVTITPDHATNKNVLWTVANGTGTATIDSVSGVLTGRNLGTVIVTAKAQDSFGRSADKTITVEEATILVNAIAITGGSTVESGKTLSLSATVTPIDATNKKVIWTVVNGTGTASINLTTGILTGGSTGTVTVTAAAQDGSGVKATHTVTITVDPENIPTGSGSLTGKACFDIAYSNGDNSSCGPIASRTGQKTNFANRTTQDPALGAKAPYSGVQVYTFTPNGTVSNVRFDYKDPSGKVIESISGGNSGNNITTPVKATVNYKSGLASDLQGLTRSNALKVDIYAVYNDGSAGNGTNRSVKLSVTLSDCACCGALIDGGVWLDFMCHNLGANESLDPFTPAAGLHGDKYRFGVKEPSLTMKEDQANSERIPDWSSKPVETGYKNDWTEANNPCPQGWRLPTETEWAQVIKTANNIQTSLGSWNSSVTNYTSGRKFGEALFLPAAGSRNNDGSVYLRGYGGRYWSSTYSTGGHYMFFDSSSNKVGATVPTYGFSLRCVAK